VHKDWPTYGLPMVEYTTILSLIETEKIVRAKDYLNMFLDQSVQDAIDRYRTVSDRDREEIRKILIKAAEYRRAYPRHLTTNDAPMSVFWNRERQIAEDQFLKDLFDSNREN